MFLRVRPRIWLTPEVLTRLRAAQFSDPRVSRIVTLGGITPPTWDIGPITYAMAYQLTGKVEYAQRALSIIMNTVGVGMGAITGDKGFATRSVLPAASIVYDWCQPAMTDLQRKVLGDQLRAWANWVWGETNPERAAPDTWGTWPSSNYFHGFMMTWMAGLALSEGGVADPLVTNAIDLHWKTKARPWLERWWTGGVLEEGTSYGIGTLMYQQQYLTAHFSAAGAKPSDFLPPNWYRSVLLAMIHLTVPYGDYIAPIGEQARVSSAPLYDYHRLVVLSMIPYLAAEEQAWARYWLDTIKPNRMQSAANAWAEALWYPADVPGIDYRAKLGRYYHAPGQGLFTRRSNWGLGGTQLVTWCGDMQEDHQDRSQGGFLINRFGWLASCARVKSASGLYKETPYHNCIMVGDVEQKQPLGGKVLFATQDERHSHIGYNVAGAYPAGVLREWRREIMMIDPVKPDGSTWIVIFDRVNAFDHLKSKIWRLHTHNPPVIAGNNYRITEQGGGSMIGTLVPINGEVMMTDRVSLGPEGALSSHVLKQATSPGRSRDYFLNILEVQAVPANTSVEGKPVGILRQNNMIDSDFRRRSGRGQYRCGARSLSLLPRRHS